MSSYLGPIGQKKAATTIPGRAFVNRPDYPRETDRERLASDNLGKSGGRPLVYLACPYSHATSQVEEWRFEQSTRAAAWLIRTTGYNVFSPITHSHPLRKIGGLSGDWKFWEKIDREYLSVSNSLVVLLIDGWRRSVGVQAEIMIAGKQGILVRWLLPLAEDKGSTGERYRWVSHPEEYKPLGMPLADEVPGCSEPVKVPGDMTNPKDLIGLTKPPLRLVPAALILYVSRVMALGAKRYGSYNWRLKKVRYTIYLEAAMRHILSALDGEEIDPESKQPHTAHAAACMGIILDAKATGNLIDDLPTPGAAARLIKELTEPNT